MEKKLGSFKIIKEVEIDGDFVEWECTIEPALKNSLKRLFGWKRLTTKRFSWVVTEALEHYLERQDSLGLPPKK